VGLPPADLLPGLDTLAQAPAAQLGDQPALFDSANALATWRWCYGKTPMQTFIHTLPVAKEKLTQAA
jgi:hypothetical protein